jgi:hypothetical protein
MPVAGDYKIPIGVEEAGQLRFIHIIIGLPFSWRIFYLMAWAFLAAQFVYYLACPEIIHRYRSYGNYRAQHAGSFKLGQLLATCVMHVPSTQIDEFCQRILRAPLDSSGESRHALSRGILQRFEAVAEPIQSDTFDWITHVENRERRAWCWVCTVA